MVGRFDVDSSGNLSNGRADAVDLTSAYKNLTLTGTFDAPSSETGRGTAALTLTPQPGANPSSLNLAYYVVSTNKIALVEADRMRTGEIEKQSGPYSTALLNAPVILQMSGSNGNNMQSGVVGFISPDGSGSINGVLDQNLESNVILDQAFSGTEAVDPSGRVTMTILGGATTNDLIAYLFGENQAFVIQTTGSDALFGSFKPQTGPPFSADSIGGVFRTARSCRLSLGQRTTQDSSRLTVLPIHDGEQLQLLECGLHRQRLARTTPREATLSGREWTRNHVGRCPRLIGGLSCSGQSLQTS